MLFAFIDEAKVTCLITTVIIEGHSCVYYLGFYIDQFVRKIILHNVYQQCFFLSLFYILNC